MKKEYRRFMSLLVVFCVVVGGTLPSFASDGSDKSFAYFTLASDYFSRFDEWFTETVDGVKYAYIVENGEATIINVQTNYWGPEEKTLVFPTTLGGYPVTTIGYDGIEVFLFLSYNDSIYSEGYDEADGSVEYIEYDPGCSYITEVVIPEGYKYIKKSGLTWWGWRKWTLPKSLRSVEQYAFEEFYNYSDPMTGEKYAFIPECDTGSHMAVTFCNNIVIPSRVPTLFCKGSYADWGYYKVLYVPYNASYEYAKRVFYTWDAAIGDAGGWYQSGPSVAVHCAPDSPWLQVFEDMGGHDYANIVTDVTPAEYIEFPEENVNVHVGDVVDLEAKTYPSEAIWTACDYVSSDPSIVKIDEYSGRITALKEGTVTITATHCERGYVDTCTVNVTSEPVPGVNGIEPATDTPYVTYGNRDYKINVTGSPSKIQVVRDNGGTTTIDRRRAQVTSNGDTETWLVNMRVEAGTHNIRAKYGNVWEPRLTPFTVTYDLPGAYSFDLSCENSIGTFDVVTDPEVIKVQLLLDNGCTLTYHQGYSYIGEDGLRHWTVTRKLPEGMRYTLRTKYGYTWTTTDLTVST